MQFFAEIVKFGVIVEMNSPARFIHSMTAATGPLPIEREIKTDLGIDCTGGLPIVILNDDVRCVSSINETGTACNVNITPSGFGLVCGYCSGAFTW